MQDRRTFLRQMSKTLAVGAGALALPAAARAAGPHASPNYVAFNCCADATHCGTCSDGDANYYCQGDHCTPFCTGCQRFTSDCYGLLYPTCP